MKHNSRILLTIAARGGSKGIKNKNIRILDGKPLIAYTIEQAKQWGKADRIVCSTDSAEIADVARASGAGVPFTRPAELAGDDVGKLDVLRHAVSMIEAEEKTKYSAVIDLDATAPVRTISDLEGAYKLFIEKKPDCVFSVTPARKNPYFNMVEINKNGYAFLSKKTAQAVKRRQDAPKVYDMNASIYVYNRDFLMNENAKSPVSSKSLVWVMNELSAFDIDTESDLRFVEFLTSKGLVKLI